MFRFFSFQNKEKRSQENKGAKRKGLFGHNSTKKKNLGIIGFY
jgi:hypothetical protein